MTKTISSKDLLKILEQTKTISKSEFAKRIGVSTPTLYAWIKKDKDGIAQYVTPDGISAEIFDADPWKAYNDESEVERRRLQDQVDDLNEEAERACDKIQELNAEIDKLTAKVELQQQTIELLQGQLSVKDQQITALLVSLNQQIKALPQPKKHWWQRRRDEKNA